MSRVSVLGMCLCKMFISSLDFFSWFQLRLKNCSLLKPLMPSKGHYNMVIAHIKIFPVGLQGNAGLKIVVWPKVLQKKLRLK